MFEKWLYQCRLQRWDQPADDAASPFDVSMASLVRVSQETQLRLIMHYIGFICPGKRLQLFDGPATDSLGHMDFTARSDQIKLISSRPHLAFAPLVWLQNDDVYSSLSEELRNGLSRLAANFCKPQHPLMQGSSDHYLIVGHVPQHQNGLDTFEDLDVLFQQASCQAHHPFTVQHIFTSSGLHARPIEDALMSTSCADAPLLQYMLVVFRWGLASVQLPDALVSPAQSGGDTAQPSKLEEAQGPQPQKQGLKRAVGNQAGTVEGLWQPAKKHKGDQGTSRGIIAGAGALAGTSMSQPISHAQQSNQPSMSQHVNAAAVGANLPGQPRSSKPDAVDPTDMQMDAATAVGSTSLAQGSGQEPSAVPYQVQLVARTSGSHHGSAFSFGTDVLTQTCGRSAGV